MFGHIQRHYDLVFYLFTIRFRFILFNATFNNISVIS